jgi:hypothetical protein
MYFCFVYEFLLLCMFSSVYSVFIALFYYCLCKYVWLLWTSDQPVTDTCIWQHKTQKTDIHAPGGTRIHNLNRRAAADLRLRPRGHWDRPAVIYETILVGGLNVQVTWSILHVSAMSQTFSPERGTVRVAGKVPITAHFWTCLLRSQRVCPSVTVANRAQMCCRLYRHHLSRFVCQHCPSSSVLSCGLPSEYSFDTFSVWCKLFILICKILLY